MRLPDCYDPVFQEERRQAAWDRWDARFPVCGCCGRKIRAGEAFFRLALPGDAVILCEDCVEALEENVCYVEDISQYPL